MKKVVFVILAFASRESEPGEEAFAALKKACSDCHQPYRNVKPKK